jgi:hypothetical protein
MAVSTRLFNFEPQAHMVLRFLLEAIGTFIIGLFSWVLMPPGPCQTKSWFRGKNGWFNEREEYIMVNRLLRDDPSKGDMNNR